MANVCLRCGTMKWLTEHHVYPQRHRIHLLKQGVAREELNRTITLCRTPCHDEIEMLYKEYENGKVLYFTRYWRLCEDFTRWLTPQPTCQPIPAH